MKPVTTLVALLSLSFGSMAVGTEETNQWYASGGVYQGGELCPKTPLDTVTPVNHLPRSSSLEVSIEGIENYIQKHKISDITTLLNSLPDQYRTHFSLVEHTRATGQSNLDFPRIVLFGSDGRFMMNVGTKPDDPAYHLLDVAQLDTATGNWEFSVFDFRSDTPQLTRNDPSCQRCHGVNDARPIWGTFQQWTGVFGDSVIAGPRPEALDHTHAKKMNALIKGNANSPRFDFLLWKPALLRRGGLRKIAHHDFGPELLISNIAFGSATALGSYTRLTQRHPQAYRDKRAALLLSYLYQRVHENNKHHHVTRTNENMAWAEAKHTALRRWFANSGYSHTPLDSLLVQLGVDPQEAFSLATLHAEESPDPSWRLANGDLYDLLMLQILNELMRDNDTIAELLSATTAPIRVFQCENVADKISALIAFKTLHLFELSGEQRYRAHWVYYPKDVDDIYYPVFLPVAEALAPILLTMSSPSALQTNNGSTGE